MDTGAIKPVPNFSAFAAPRAAGTQPAVAKTDLPEEATVRPADETSEAQPVRDRRPDHQAQRINEPEEDQEVERRVERDDDTNSLVYRSIDTQSGHVVDQLPSESLLKLRAYVESSQSTGDEPVAHDHTHIDRTA